MQRRSAHSRARRAKWLAGEIIWKNKRNLCNTDLHTQKPAKRNDLRGKSLEKSTQPLQHRSAYSKDCHAKWLAGKKRWKHLRNFCNTDLHTQACHAKWPAGKQRLKNKRNLGIRDGLVIRDGNALQATANSISENCFLDCLRQSRKKRWKCVLRFRKTVLEVRVAPSRAYAAAAVQDQRGVRREGWPLKNPFRSESYH